jgi:hypothetical protein
MKLVSQIDIANTTVISHTHENVRFERNDRFQGIFVFRFKPMSLHQFPCPKWFRHRIRSVIETCCFFKRARASDSRRSAFGNPLRSRAIGALGCLIVMFANPMAAASSVSFEWDANPEPSISGYLLSYGTALGNYPNSVKVGITPSATVSGLKEGTTYYFVVAAVDTAGLRSPPSEVVSYFVPVAPPVNRPPVAFASSLAVPEDTPLNIVLAGTDPDNDPITYSVVRAPGKGSLSGTAPNLRYTPSADLNGTDSFTFRVFDGTAYSAAATVIHQHLAGE